MKAILWSIQKPHTDNIRSRLKLDEIRKRIPKGITIDTVNYIYETKANGGCGKVIASFRVIDNTYIYYHKDMNGTEHLCNTAFICPCISDEERKIKVFYGHTATQSKYIPHCDFLSIEPVLAPLNEVFYQFDKVKKAIIIGAETGNRKGKVIPKREWIDDIVREADKRGLAVFMKNSLKDIMGVDFRQDKLPWQEVEK
jgi:hypothetical protein